jgi:hypothetical protein
MIVTSRHRRKHTAKRAQTAKIAVPRIVQQTPRGKAWKLLPPDPDADDARVAAFFARMGATKREGA